MRLADAPSGRLIGGSMTVAVTADEGQTASAAFIGDYGTAQSNVHFCLALACDIG